VSATGAIIEKEVRALLPVWTACALAIVASRWLFDLMRYLGLPAYFIGSAAVGAWSIGHEYAHGTLPSMLALPVPRWRWWVAKLAVLAPMLASLALLAAYSFPLERPYRDIATAIWGIPVLAALTLAPWLTMVARGPLAGAVFSVGTIGLLLVVSEWIGIKRYGITSEVDHFRIAFMWWSMGALGIAGAVLGWRTFARLDVYDGPGHDVQLSLGRPATSAVRTRRSPAVALVAKELRLQQLSFVVGALLAALYVAILISTGRAAEAAGAAAALMAFSAVVIPIVVGSLACAEERSYGTLEAQLMLPVPSATQWIVKATVAFAVSGLLAILLPVLLLTILPPTHSAASPKFITPQLAVFAAGFTAVSLYVSALSRSGLRAIVAAIGAVMATAYFVTRVGGYVGDRVFVAVHAMRPPHHDHHMFVGVGAVFFFAVPLVLFVLLAVTLALPAFRYVDRRVERLLIHAAIAAGGILAYVIAVNVWLALRF
jgi:ABC-type transport system involved in multi-copper enzyme maturation permease subunit